MTESSVPSSAIPLHDLEKPQGEPVNANQSPDNQDVEKLVHPNTSLNESEHGTATHLSGKEGSESHGESKSHQSSKSATDGSTCMDVEVNEKDTKETPLADKDVPRVFVELNELVKEEGHAMQWKEKARWIKFEEDVEEVVHKWGKPHVASLSLHSLVELRRYLEGASCLMDLKETDLPEIFHRLVDQMILSNQAREDDREHILRTLLLEHTHFQDRSGLLKIISTVGLIGSLFRSSNVDAKLKHHEGRSEKRRFRKLSNEPADVDCKKDEVHIPMLSQEDHDNINSSSTVHYSDNFLSKKLDEQRVKGIMKKIPQDTEATTVLVGELDSLKKPAVIFVRLAQGTRLSNLTEVPIPVRILFVMLGPGGTGVDYHEIGRSFSTLMSNEHFQHVAYKAESIDDLLNAMDDFVDHTIILPPGKWDKNLLLPVLRIQNEKMMEKRKVLETPNVIQEDNDNHEDITVKKADLPEDDNPLQRTGKLFGGLIKDIKRRYSKYKSDILDGLNLHCLAVFVFIYFAQLAPMITFGGLLAEKVNNWMGVSEILIGSSISAVIFALFSGQPLHIIGTTGPILVFEENLYQFCLYIDIEYLPYRIWVGIWLFIITIIVVAFEGSTLVRYFTRFMEETFNYLIGMIFIYEPLRKVFMIFLVHPLRKNYCVDYEDFESATFVYNESMYGESTTFIYNESTSGNLTYVTMQNNDTSVCSSIHNAIVDQPNTALLSAILCMGTFFLSYYLTTFRHSKYFGRTGRKMIGDFGIPIAILIMCIFDFFLEDTYTQKLEVPTGLQPTDACKRGWYVNPLGMNQWMTPLAIVSAIIPGLLAFILMYMETLIVTVILNKKEYKMTKGSGFHLDLLILGGLVCGSGFFGFPWVWPATIRTVTHAGSLALFNKSNAPGEKPQLQSTREQRVTALMVNIMIGFSLALAPFLRQIPLAVLYGVFLYMGVASLNGIQMVDRTKLLFMPSKHHPDVHYVREVKTYRMHLYTIIQLTFLCFLWVVKLSAIALAFPFFLILLAPIRLLLPRIFSKRELDALDSPETSEYYQKIMEEENEEQHNDAHI